MERKTMEIQNPACGECRARKLKCSRSRPSCSFCTKHKKACTYSLTRQRVPLTRAYVSGLEKRIKSLEQMLLAANPDLALGDVVTQDSIDSQTQSLSVFPSEERVIESHENEISETRLSTPESLPPGPSGFDWGKAGDRSVDDPDEGQNISISPEGAGYQGKFTSVTLLRTLCKVGSRWRNAPIRPPTCPSHLQLIGEYSNGIPWVAIERSDCSEGFADFLIDSYFRHFHTTYPLLHEATFRAQYNEVIPRPPAEAWSLLSRSVFAIGAWCTGCWISTGNENDPLDCFQLFENIDLFRSGSLCMVQALTLLACYLDKQSKSNTASLYLAAAVKMGMSLGLHKEFSGWDISLLDREIRRRVWWCLFVLESGQSMAMGRPILLPCPRTITIKPPLNIPEQLLTSRTTEQPKELPGLTIYSNLIAQVEFHLMINATFNHCINNPDLPAKEILNVNAKIDSWVKALPPHLQEDAPQPSFPRLNFASHHLLWRVRGLKIVLFFRTFVHVTRMISLGTNPDQDIGDGREVISICVGYAHTIIASIERFFAKEMSNPLRDWYARYCLIQSALVLILALQTNFDLSQDQRPMLISDFEKITILLAKVSDQDPLARTILDIMNRVLLNPSEGNFVDTVNSFVGEEFLDLLSLPLDEHIDPWLWPLWGESS